jgi:hypothetical protein
VSTLPYVDKAYSLVCHFFLKKLSSTSLHRESLMKEGEKHAREGIFTVSKVKIMR